MYLERDARVSCLFPAAESGQGKNCQLAADQRGGFTFRFYFVAGISPFQHFDDLSEAAIPTTSGNPSALFGRRHVQLHLESDDVEVSPTQPHRLRDSAGLLAARLRRIMLVYRVQIDPF